VTFLLGDDNSQMTNTLSREFALGFEQLGLSSRCVLASSIKSVECLEREISANDTTLFVSLSGQGMDLSPKDNAYHKLNAPLFLMLLDHPLHHWDKVEIPIGLNAISTLSKADQEFVNKYSTHKRIAFQLPHAANPQLPQPWKVKEIELFYCGTLRENPVTQRQNWSKFGKLIESRLNAILEEHIASVGEPLVASIRRILAGIIDCSKPMVIHPYYVTLDLYLRDHLRVEALKSIEKAPLNLAGAGWETVLGGFKNSNVSYLGAIHPNDVRSYYARAKVVLNFINTYHESHDRVFSAIADGSVVLTSTSEFYSKTFSADELILYDQKENNLEEICQKLIFDDARLREIAENGRQKLLSEHTWRHRAETTLKELGNLQAAPG